MAATSHWCSTFACCTRASGKKVSSMKSTTAGIDLTPLTDIVFPGDEDELEAIFDRHTLKLVGSLHRRFWSKRREMLKTRATSEEVVKLTATPSLQPDVEFGEIIADLRSAADSWTDRLDEMQSLRHEIDLHGIDAVPPVVRIRGWEHTEPGLLVDGRAVPGCIVDIVVALRRGAELFREGEQAFTFDIPAPADSQEAKLWTDLFDLAHDRTGLERGTVSFGTIYPTRSDRREIAVA